MFYLPILLRLIDGTSYYDGQRLDNVNQTHLVPASGKQLLQKNSRCSESTLKWQRNQKSYILDDDSEIHVIECRSANSSFPQLFLVLTWAGGVYSFIENFHSTSIVVGLRAIFPFA